MYEYVGCFEGRPFSSVLLRTSYVLLRVLIFSDDDNNIKPEYIAMSNWFFQVANCHEELDTVCRNDRSLECLKKLPHQSISPPCRRIIFRQEKEEIMMNSIDPVIARMCGNEIKTHCSDTNGDANSILNCLKVRVILEWFSIISKTGIRAI